jgi:monoamine oxidase
LAELGLANEPQYDPGDALWLTDSNREPERRLEPGGVHVGARRITGGAARLVDALAASLPQGCIRLGAAVNALRDRGAFLELLFDTGHTLRARQVVLALPPRLVFERIQFAPALPDAVLDALTATPTWMAVQAKSVTTFASPFWRTEDQSGNAFVRHPQAVLAEVFDASASGGGGALGGFVALNAAQRENFRRGLPLLIASQLGQLFGPKAQDGQPFLQDWATEPWTCSAMDRAGPSEPPQNDPLLRQPLWAGRVFLGGSEAAAHGAGHMEGALEAADRIAHAVCRPNAAVRSAAQQASLQAHPMTDDARPTRATALGNFSASVLSLRGMAPQRYRLHLTRLLSGQQSEQLTQRALLATADQVYSETLARLDQLLPALDTAKADVINGRHALTAALLAPFDGWNKGLLDAALSFNGTSCALSNFPQEHRPDPDTVRAITLDLAAAWREFALELNARLLTAATVAETA